MPAQRQEFTLVLNLDALQPDFSHSSACLEGQVQSFSLAEVRLGSLPRPKLIPNIYVEVSVSGGNYVV